MFASFNETARKVTMMSKVREFFSLVRLHGLDVPNRL